MSKVLGFVLATVVAVGVSVSHAGPGCCPASKAKAKAEGAGCADVYSKLNLTDAQKTKLTALDERVKRAPSTSEGRELYRKGLEEILTADQVAQCKELCTKDKGSCPLMDGKAAKKS